MIALVWMWKCVFGHECDATAGFGGDRLSPQLRRGISFTDIFPNRALSHKIACTQHRSCDRLLKLCHQGDGDNLRSLQGGRHEVQVPDM